MLNGIQKSKFTTRAKKEVKKLLANLKIEKLDNDSLGELLDDITLNVSTLVTMQESENLPIDEELLEIYDLLTDIILDNENDLAFLNKLFFN